ncbi:transposase [Streptomyces sp. NPDC059525]|uniref:transposase n=1 Tax=Streptomyces sp. NPDC059525 TaxID=3346857 RepID=UPI0036A7FE4F
MPDGDLRRTDTGTDQPSRPTHPRPAWAAGAGRRVSGRPARSPLGPADGDAGGEDTLLRLLRTSALEEPGAVRVLGVDEFALLKGHNYATLLVDLESRRPIDVLPGREAETVARWLQSHPEVEIVCHDQASAYAEAARTAAPQAVQIADVRHLWNNLAKAVERTLTSHYACICASHEAARPPDGEASPGSPRAAATPASCSVKSVNRDFAVTAPSSTATSASSSKVSRPPLHHQRCPNRDVRFDG